MDTETAPPTDTSASATGTAPEAPWYASTFSPDKPGEFIPDWHTKAPEDQRGRYERYKDAKTPWDLVTAAEKRVETAQTELRNRAAVDKGLPLRPEGEAATPEAWKAYREARGLPADATGYGIKKPEGYPDAIWSDQEAGEFAAFALENDLTPAQVKALSEWYQGRGLSVFETHQANEAAKAEEETRQREAHIQNEISEMVKNHGPSIDPLINRINKLVGHTGMDPERLNPRNPERFVGADVVKALEFMAASVPKYGDDTRKSMGRNDDGSVKDRSYYTGPNWKKGQPDYDAFMDRSNPRHADVVRQRENAYALEAQSKQ